MSASESVRPTASARNTNHNNKGNKLNKSFARPTVIKTEVFDNIEVPDYAICSCQYVSFFNDGSKRSGVSYFGPQVVCDDCGLQVHNEAVTQKFVSQNFGLHINDARIKTSREFKTAERLLCNAQIFETKTLARLESARVSVTAHYAALQESLDEITNFGVHAESQADFYSENYTSEEVLARVSLALPVALAWQDVCSAKNQLAIANRYLAERNRETVGFDSVGDPTYARFIENWEERKSYLQDAESVYESALKHHDKNAPVKFDHNILLVDAGYNKKGKV